MVKFLLVLVCIRLHHCKGSYDVYKGPRNPDPAVISGAQWPVNEPLCVAPDDLQFLQITNAWLLKCSRSCHGSGNQKHWVRRNGRHDV